MRKTIFLHLLFLPVLALLSGCKTWTDLEDVSCPPQGTSLTYDNFGKKFVGTYCNECHSVRSHERNGAPAAYVFDTHDQVYLFRERIFLRAAGDNTSMPPGPDDPPLAERDKLAEWIACGAPKLHGFTSHEQLRYQEPFPA
jgi:uncharacterized membrane protein